MDDEPGITDMIREYFEPEYEVYMAYSGGEAIQKLSVKPDLIFLDINMPEMDGLEVYRQIRGFVSCPILFLTARVESPDKITGFQAGADDYIVKPFELDELGARVAAHLRREQRKLDNRTAGRAVRFFGELAVDYGTRSVSVNGKPVSIETIE